MSIEIDNLLFNIEYFESKFGCPPHFLVMNPSTYKILEKLNPYDNMFYGIRVAINDSLDDFEIEIV